MSDIWYYDFAPTPEYIANWFLRALSDEFGEAVWFDAALLIAPMHNPEREVARRLACEKAGEVEFSEYSGPRAIRWALLHTTHAWVAERLVGVTASDRFWRLELRPGSPRATQPPQFYSESHGDRAPVPLPARPGMPVLPGNER